MVHILHHKLLRLQPEEETERKRDGEREREEDSHDSIWCQTTKQSWQRFVSNSSVIKQNRSYVLQWAQWMLAELGATDVLLCLAASSTPQVPLPCGK